MKISAQLSNSDLLLLRNAAIVFLLLTTISVSLIIGSNTFQTNSSRNLSLARASYEQVVNSVTQIAQEEATIIQYIDRYRHLEQDGIVAKEDRLKLLEELNSIRDQFQLYPLRVSIEDQVSHTVPYPLDDPLPGEPVVLQQTVVNLSLTLLHEGDLLNTIDNFLELPELLQPVYCEIELNSGASTGVVDQLRENLLSSCRFHWYTFSVSPTQNVSEEGF